MKRQISSSVLLLLFTLFFVTESFTSRRQGRKASASDLQRARTGCIGGEKCDQCARGFIQDALLTSEHPVHDRQIPHGEMPMCLPCGECFTNWERILAELRNQTDEQIAKAEQVKVTGTTGAYTRVFEEMEAKLKEIKDILDSASISNDELVGVQKDIDKISGVLADTTARLNDLDSDLASTKQAMMQGNSQLEYLRSDADKLKLNAQDMKDSITRLQEANVEGALNLTREAKRRSDEAALRVKNVQGTGGLLVDSEIQRRATETLMNNSRVPFSKTQEQNQETLKGIVTQIENLEEKIPDLNKQVCDGTTSTSQACDELCGGAGCGKCGGLSCLNGALSKAEGAVKSAESADKMLVEKDRKAERVLIDITKVHQKSQAAADTAQAAYDLANEAKNRSMGEMSRVNDLVTKIEGFTSGDKAKPEDVKDLANQCMSAELSLGSDQIQELANQINDAISGVVNVDEILSDTAEDVQKAGDLKSRAEQVRADAEQQLAHAERVTAALSQAEEAQNQADTAIQSTQEDIDSARKDLAQIETDMKAAMNEADLSVLNIQDLAARQKTLQTDFIKNQNHVSSAQKAAEDAKKQASKANTELYKLNIGFKNVSVSLDSKTDSIGSAKDRAVDLQQRANALATSASNQLSNLLDIEKEFEENERRLMELSSELVSLNCEMQVHLQVIEDKSNYYRTCSPPDTWTPLKTCTCSPGAQEPSCTARRAVDVDY